MFPLFPLHSSFFSPFAFIQFSGFSILSTRFQVFSYFYLLVSQKDHSVVLQLFLFSYLVSPRTFAVWLFCGFGGRLTMIREMAREDIPVCVDVIRKSFLTVADEFGFSVENAARFTAFSISEERLYWQLEQEKRTMIVDVENGQICGYYSLLFPIEDGANARPAAELSNLCVLPSFRHSKIGETLLTDAFARAKQLGAAVLHIGIVEENEILRRWYERFGFVHTGTKKFDFFPFTCGYMERAL